MRKTSKRAVCEVFRIRADVSVGGSRGIWIDLWGNSYHNMAGTPKQAKQMARQFRETAKWLETKGVNYLKGS